MKIISQTPANDNGDYTITYVDKDGNVITRKLNLFDF